MPGMNTGLNAGDPAVVAAFRRVLEHQAVIALAIFAVLGFGWLASRLLRPSADARPGPARRPSGLPAGRQLLAVGFGNLWLFDGFLQLQPKMALGLPSQVIEPTAASSPSWVQHVVNWAATAWSYHPTQAAAAAVWIQVGLGIWLLAAPRGAMSRLAGLASAGWGLVVWVFGESFGGIFAPGLSWLSGAPGAAAIYVAAGVLLALPDSAWRSPRLGRCCLAGLGVFLAGMAVLQAWPGRGSWQGTVHGQPGVLAGMAQAMSLTPQPGFLAGWLVAFAHFDQAHGFAVNLVVVTALAVSGTAFASGRSQLIRPALAGFAVLCLADWVLVQDLGFLGGLGTDPNSMIPLILLAVGCYLALTRPTTQAAEAAGVVGPATTETTTGPLPRLLRPVVLRERAVAARAWMVAAAGGAGLVLLGAVPMAIAQASPNADVLIAQAIVGRAAPRDYRAPQFALTDQYGQRVTLASMRGRIVLLSFINPACTAGCPPVWQEFSQAARLAGSSTRPVELVAIAVSRSAVTVAKLAAFDRREGLAGLADWRYLTGPRRELQQLWYAYGISVREVSAQPMSIRSVAYVIDAAGYVRAEYRTGPGPGTAAISSSFAVLFAEAARQAMSAQLPTG